MKEKFNIDAVILWVDGDDPIHKSKLISHLPDPSKVQSKALSTRFRQVNEIEYAVQSIIKFAPFISSIYIVTDNQIPSFLKEEDALERYKKVKIIDHSVIFRDFESVLPVFNSNAIETVIHRIPSLSEHYVYFNDDMLLMKPTVISDFFTEDGFPIIRGRKMVFESNKIYKKIPIVLGLKKVRTKGYLGYKRIQDYFAQLMGEKTKICVDHTPFPMRKSTITTFFEKHPSIFQNNIAHKFRNEKNVLIQSVSAYAEVKERNELLNEDYQMARFDSVNKPLFWIKIKFFFFKNNPKKIFLNIQSLDLYPQEKLTYILSTLNDLYKK